MPLRPTAVRHFVLTALAIGATALGSAAALFWLFGRLVSDQNRLAELGSHLPTPAAALLPALAALFLHRLGHRRSALTCLGIALVPAVVLAAIETRWRATPAAEAVQPNRGLVHWNVEWNLAGWDRLIPALEPRARDLVVLSEVPVTTDLDALAAQLGPGFYAVRLSNMALFTREQPEAVRRIADEFFLKLFEVEWSDPALKLLVVDIVSAPTVRRWPQLDRVAKEAAARRVDLVVGDFNTPKVQLLRHLPAGFVDAYTCCGRGWSATWPMPLPVLALDHMLLGPRIRTHSYTLGSSRWSDHRLQELRFSLEPQARRNE